MNAQQIIDLFGPSQCEMARKTGIPQTTISNWTKHGIPPWRRFEIVECAKELGIKINGRPLQKEDFD